MTFDPTAADNAAYQAQQTSCNIYNRNLYILCGTLSQTSVLFVSSSDSDSIKIVINCDYVIINWVGQVADSPLKCCGCIFTAKQWLQKKQDCNI